MDYRAIIKYAGAFMAWVIGSGFATGQEVLRFFSSYGYWSYVILAVDLIGFLIVGKTLMLIGFKHRLDKNFQHFKYYCGTIIGSIYLWTMPFVWFIMMAVLFSAAGATLFEYFGLYTYLGSAMMASAVLGAYLIGFDRFVKIVSKISPIVVIFCFIVGFISITDKSMQDMNLTVMLEDYQVSPFWFMSALAYLSLDFLTGSAYYSNLGAVAKNEQAIKWGAILGSIILIIVITTMNTAVLLNIKNAAVLSVPTLYLAKNISYIFAGAFSIVLLLGMFSSCAATMWSICSNFFVVGSKKNKIVSIFVVLVAYVISLFPFGELVGLLFPFIGYYGFIYIICVIYKAISMQLGGKNKR